MRRVRVSRPIRSALGLSVGVGEHKHHSVSRRTMAPRRSGTGSSKEHRDRKVLARAQNQEEHPPDSIPNHSIGSKHPSLYFKGEPQAEHYSI